MGYLKLDVNTLVSTHTRAQDVPQGYNPKKLAVKILNSAGSVVKETYDFANDQEFKGNIQLQEGTYTITASSAGWDGSNSGFDAPYYAGSTQVTIQKKTLSQASVTLTQANVKVTVNYSAEFRTSFKAVECLVTSSLAGVYGQTFGLYTTGSAYFPVAPLNFKLSVTNLQNINHSESWPVNDVKARDHYIINFKVAKSEGSIGGVTVKVDDDTQSYTYDIEIPCLQAGQGSISLNASAANAFSSFAYLTGTAVSSVSGFSDANLSLQWKKASDAEWTTVPASSLTKAQNTYTYKLTNLTPATDYVYRMSYKDGAKEVNSDEVNFTTESLLQPENPGFENWSKDGSVWYPNVQGSHYWDSSNPGSASMGDNYNITTQTTDAHSGNYAADLQSKYIVIKFAAASVYTGDFVELVGTKGAIINWGKPFASRPSKFTGWMKYTPGSVNRVSKSVPSGAPAKGENDQCQIFCALLTERIQIDNTKIDETFPKWDGSDPRVIAYGAYSQNSADGSWKQFEIPLTYFDSKTKPTHLLIVCSSSKYGDYFHGSDASNLKLDDFSFEYGEPTFQ